ncbi:FadR/GntR family transcriptional regulator [Novosphingobium cyanobacteriorum]|uniref:FadR/GntR family transcriptional regulator n=1 Tax=Novosphingobium cyanobacteriorum TaxID=3024215 RepID=UPI0023F78244|nr:FCD domain-containing protein [Novosphingobium cyanobacteriorum]
MVERIRAMIVEGHLKPGDKLPPERDLSVRLGVGRNAVREGLRALEQAGIVDLRPGKTGGAFVTSGRPNVISENMRDLLSLGNISFDDLWETRLLLADVVIRLVVENMTDEDLAALEANVARARLHYESGRLREKSRCNIEFHDVLAAATHNPLLGVFMTSIADLVRHFTEQLGSDPGQETLRSRERLLVALRARNGDAAIAEMRRDLIRVHEFYKNLARSSSVPPS